MAEHNLPREEWERNFAERIRKQFLTVFPEEKFQEWVKAELESWPESDPEWSNTLPEDAAESNMSHWEE